MSKRKRVLFVILIVLAVIVVVAAVVWFAVVPGVIHSKLESAFAKVEEKTGRHISVSDVSLKSPTRVVLTKVSVSDVGKPETEAIRIDAVDLNLAHIPGLSEIRLGSIDVGNIDVSVTREDGKYNFEDLRKLLSKSDDESDESSPKSSSESSGWKRYITPLPEINVASVQVTVPSIEIMPSVLVTSVGAEDIKIRWKRGEDERQKVVFSSNISASFTEEGKKVSYTTAMEGEVASATEGTVTLTMPRNSYGEIPAPFRPESYVADAEAVQITLPSTVSLIKPKLEHGSDTLFKADELRVQLMAVPPKKVNGVYIKEFELKSPVVQLNFYDETNDVSELLSTFRDKLNNKPKSASQNQPYPAKAKKRSINDYYFSQRFFISDGSVILRDFRSDARGDVRVDHVSLESGYRGIRKVVDYEIEVVTTAPMASKVELAGEYDLREHGITASLNVEYVNANDATHLLQKRLREMINDKAANDGADKGDHRRVSTLERLFASLDFHEATGHARASVTGNIDTKVFSINASGDTTGVSFLSPAISAEPLSLDVSTTLSASLDLSADPVISIKKLKLERDNTYVEFSARFAREHVEKQKTIGKLVTKSEYDTWNYKFSVDMPDQDAQGVFNSIPHALRSELDGLQVQGTIGLKLDVDGRMDAIEDTNHKLVISKSPNFHINSWPSGRDINKLNRGFRFEVNDPRALEPHEIVIPPSTYPATKINSVNRVPVEIYTPKMSSDDIRFRFPNWVLFEDLNPWLVQLITTTEDGSFFTHEGFSAMQIKAALAKNVQVGSFNRGASTISMQLTKNVFFDRTKTVSRKVQEALYTWLMETEISIPKQRIMEIYFNIIEFGPEIYGIEEASKYYFGKRSEALSLKEAAFLIAIIPQPRRGETYRRQGTISKKLTNDVDFFIREMYRRKCSPKMLEQMHARYAKKKQPVPFEPCCPSESSLALMQQQEVKFYVPDPAYPMRYGYNPALYTEDGRALVPIHRSCGYNAEASTEGLGSIFEVFDDSSLPASDNVRD